MEEHWAGKRDWAEVPTCHQVIPGMPLLCGVGGVGGVKGSSLTSSLISALCQAEAGPSQGRRQSHAEVKSSHCSAHRRPRAKELGKETAGGESPGAPGSPSCPRPRLPQRPDRQLQELPGAAGGGRRKESGSLRHAGRKQELLSYFPGAAFPHL